MTITRQHVNIILAALVAILAVAATWRHFANARMPVRVHTPSASERAMRRKGPPLGSQVKIQDLSYNFFKNYAKSSSGDAPFRTLSDDGRITKGALDYIGFDYARRREIQLVVNAAYEKIESRIKERLRLVPEESDDGTGRQVYQVPAVRGEGEEILQEMATNLAAVVGESEAMTLLSGMDLRRRYSLFGMNDTRIEITPRSEDARRPEEEFSVKIVQSDPETQAVVMTLTSSFDGLKRSYGKVFQLQQEK